MVNGFPRPLIGVPCRYDRSGTYKDEPVILAQSPGYLNAVSQAGGIPLMIALGLDETAQRTLYDLCDGLLLSGGGDVTPSLFDQAPYGTLSDVQPERDEIEIRLGRWAVDEGKPVLGICRGIQVMAVAGGGTLYQDLPSQLPQAELHRYSYVTGNGPGLEELVHEVKLRPASGLSEVLGAEALWVNSLHHQAVATVPPPWQITGYASDGVVEGLELPAHPFCYGVQWHPELLVNQPDSIHRRLFEAFIAACAAYHIDSKERQS